MNKSHHALIPTNIITGFLGVGKTTVIKNLLAQKPEEERWAVLVNEFGEVGIDSNLFSRSAGDNQGVTISQVPGGCMCCANGLPMQMALNLLLAKSKPHRLLIEPTGLGHPKEVLSILKGQYYQNVLQLHATLALVDSRKVHTERYISNTIFNEQLEIAEVIVANKSDLYGAGDFAALINYIDSRFGLNSKLIYQVRYGIVSMEWLENPASKKSLEEIDKNAHTTTSSALPPTIEVPNDGYICKENQGEGFFSRGWVFSPSWYFGERELISLIHSIDVERVKGVFRTRKGALGFNKAESAVSQTLLPRIEDSRIELISRNHDALDGVEEALLACVIERDPSISLAENIA